jgi:hypothetical protein
MMIDNLGPYPKLLHPTPLAHVVLAKGNGGESEGATRDCVWMVGLGVGGGEWRVWRVRGRR